ncbi:19434_t:CDS:2, partial [Racocetra persica]
MQSTCFKLQEITKNTIDLLDYYLKKLIEIEQYICFDENIATSKVYEDKEALTNQININFEECDDSIQASVSNRIVVASEDISKNTVFNSWTEVEAFFEKYRRRNRFIVIKYRVRKDKAGIKSTAQVESYNSIKTQWNRFHQYKDSTTFFTIPVAGNDLFSTVTKIIDQFFIKVINNMIKAKMTQCLFLIANRIEPTAEELNFNRRSIKTFHVDDNQVISKEKNYTESNTISNDNYYTDNATSDNK